MALCDFDAVITVQPIPAPSHLLRLIDDRRCSLRADGLPPFTATCVLVPTSDDPSIAEVCGLALAQDGAYFGWHVRALRELLNVGRACGYRRLVANTDGRLWPGWVLIVGCWSWRRRMSSSHLQNRHPPRRIRARLMPSTRPGAAGVRAVSVMAAA